MTVLPASWKQFHEKPAVAAAALLACVLLLAQPAQIHADNDAFFVYGLRQLLLVLVPAFLLLFALLFGVARIGGRRWQRGAEVAVAGLALACWVSASFFTASTGILDGREMLRLADRTQVWVNAACYVALLAAGGMAMARWPQLTRRLFAALFAVLALHAAWTAASDRTPWRAAPEFERLATFSAERNVFVLLLDGFQSDFLADALEADPALKRSLEGFTYFPDAVGSAPTTYLSMPTIHGGVPVQSGDGIRSLYRERVVEQSFVNKLAAAGYDAMLVNPMLNACPGGAACDHSDQLVHGRTATLGENAIFLVNLAVFRAAPHAAKPLVFHGGRWRTPRHLFTDFALTSDALLERLGREAKPGAARPTVRFVHLFNTHPPARLDAGCRPVDDVAWARAAAVAQARCAMSRVAGLLETLRRTGLYDATAIVLLADHGAGLPRDPEDGFLLGAAASPTLAVKPLGARGPFAVSRDVVGLADVAATVCGMTGACTAPGGANVLAGGVRKASYPFLSYTWSGAWGADAVPVLGRYEVSGPPGNPSSWTRLTGFPEQTLTRLAFAQSDPASAYGFGWSGFDAIPGSDVRWSIGRQADVFLRVENAADMRLQLDVQTHPGNAGQTMRVEFNGMPLGEVPLGVNRSRIELPVPQRALRAGVNHLVFGFRSAHPPGGADTRPLAALFHELSLLPAANREVQAR